MSRYTYRLTLSIKHPSRDLADVPNQLGLVAKRIWKSGDPRKTPKGKDLQGNYKDSYCAMRVSAEIDPDDDVPSGISSAIELLKPHKDFLLKLTDQGANIHLSVGWFIAHNSGDNFSWQLQKELAELKSSLSLDIYGSEEVFLLAHKSTSTAELKIIGIYSSEEWAEEVLGKTKLLPGFSDNPEDFYIERFMTDEERRNEGYVAET